MRAIESITVTTKKGAPLHLLIKECLNLAIKEWATVGFVWSGWQYSINPEEVFDFIVKRARSIDDEK